MLFVAVIVLQHVAMSYNPRPVQAMSVAFWQGSSLVSLAAGVRDSNACDVVFCTQLWLTITTSPCRPVVCP